MGAGPGTNTGHGHVWPRPDGVRMRCGGCRLCQECMADHAEFGVEVVLGRVQDELQKLKADNSRYREVIEAILEWKKMHDDCSESMSEWDDGYTQAVYHVGHILDKYTEGTECTAKQQN